MMKRILLLAGVFLLSVTINAQKQGTNYQFSVDLTKVKNDKLEVSLITPKISAPEITYYFPKIVPGTYAIYDFGRYISDFQAFDAKGKSLKTEKADENGWKIKDAAKLYKITYKVDDTWDSPEIKGADIFEPAGTNIEEGKSFAVNTFGFFGYFDGMKKAPYQVTFTKPAGFYGSTSMIAAKSDTKTDTYQMSSYMDLADAPLMYHQPDTALLYIGGAEVLVGVYSPNKKANAKEIAADIRTTLEAQKEYLGGKLPIKKYAFIIYLSDNPNLSRYGALEHSYSSFYYLPEATSAQLSKTVKDVASHEFFHILTPLSIHSEEIGDFNYNRPKMSRHLWMYEGLTEYAAHHMQVKYGLISLDEYLKRQHDKIESSLRNFDDALPFTEMSEAVLDKYEAQYGNVYEKGALIGLCLDIKLRQLSGGKYGTQNMMQDLAKSYGKDKSFKDSELFKKIVELTYPEVGTFFDKYVAGKEPLPLEETFASIGVLYQKTAKIKKASLGSIALGYNQETNHIFVRDISQANDFGKKMGYQKGDEILTLNGEAFTPVNARALIDKFNATAKEGDLLTITVLRKDAAGKEAEVKLSEKVQIVETEENNLLKQMPNPTPEQLALRKAWLDTGK
jgi:predicted metalloprotease with PDZ domain